MTLTRGTFLLVAGPAFLAIVVYANALRNPFVYDDYHTVEANPSIAVLSDVGTIVAYDVKRPLVNVSYAVDRAIYGPSPFGFHLTNVLLHTLNVVLLFGLTTRLTGRREAAVAAAALFAVHPMMTEGVGYISGRSEVLCATFLLAAMLSGFAWIRTARRASLVLAVLFWACSMATKEIGVMFPLALLACDWFVAGEDTAGRRRRLAAFYMPLAGCALLAATARLAVLAWIEYPGAVRMHWAYLPMAVDVVRRYLSLMLVPARQTVFHSVSSLGPTDLRVLVSVASLAVLGVIAWRSRDRHAAAGFGIVWFFLLLAPSSALALLDQGEPMAEHRVYAASAGLFLAAGAGFAAVSDDLRRRQSGLELATRIALGVVVLALGAQTVARNAIWSDPVALWQESVDLAPGHFRPRLLLGEALQNAGRIDEAAREFRTAIRLRPDVADGYVKLAEHLAATGQLAEARSTFLDAVEVDPANAAAHRGLDAVDRALAPPR